MIGSVLRGLGSAAAEGINAVGDVAQSSLNITASLVDGEKPNAGDLITLTAAGWTIAEIATFYGVADRVIQDMMES